mgnify:CR=1 FL=1
MSGVTKLLLPVLLLTSAVAANAASTTLEAKSDGHAKFYRNGVLLHDAAGFGSGRGVNIVVLNPVTFETLAIYAFDTWNSPANASRIAEQFIMKVPMDRIVMIAIADASNLDARAADVFRNRLGSQCAAKASFRDTWAAISQNGTILAEECIKAASVNNWAISGAKVTLNTPTPTDTIAPAGAFRVNHGASQTDSTDVMLDFTGIYDAGSEMSKGGKVRLSNDGANWSMLLDFQANQEWQLTRRDGLKTVYAQFSDSSGNWTSTITASIWLAPRFPLRTDPQTNDYANHTHCMTGGTLVSLSSDGVVWASANRGATWTKARTVLSNPPSWGAIRLDCDVSGAVTASGLTYDSSKITVSVNTSSDGGFTWGSARTRTLPMRSASEVSVLGACSPSNGSLMVFWSATVASRKLVLVSVTRNAGFAWDQPNTVDDVTGTYISGYGSAFQLACSNSTVLVGIRANGLKILRSGDSAASFAQVADAGANSSVSDYRLVMNPEGEACLIASTFSQITSRCSGDGAIWSLPRKVADVRASALAASFPGPGVVSVAWGAGRAIGVATSRDGGSSWPKTPASIALGSFWFNQVFGERSGGSFTFQFAANVNGHIALAVQEGRVAIYDVQRFGVMSSARLGREDKSNTFLNESYTASSNDFGETWGVSDSIIPTPLDTSNFNVYDLLVSPQGVAVVGFEFGASSYLDVRDLNESSTPAPRIDVVHNAAIAVSGPIAPGMILTLYGEKMGPEGLTVGKPSTTGLVDTRVNGTQISINGIAAPLLYTRADQVGAVVPFGIIGKTADVVVRYENRVSAPITVEVEPASPGVFTTSGSGKGQVAALNQDGSLNSETSPAKTGSVVTFYMTGNGQTVPASVDGRITSWDLPASKPVNATLGGKIARVAYAGAAPDTVSGVIQVNLQIPEGVSGTASLQVQVGTVKSPLGVTLFVAR